MGGEGGRRQFQLNGSTSLRSHSNIQVCEVTTFDLTFQSQPERKLKKKK